MECLRIVVASATLDAFYKTLGDELQGDPWDPLEDKEFMLGVFINGATLK